MNSYVLLSFGRTMCNTWLPKKTQILSVAWAAPGPIPRYPSSVQKNLRNRTVESHLLIMCLFRSIASKSSRSKQGFKSSATTLEPRGLDRFADSSKSAINVRRKACSTSSPVAGYQSPALSGQQLNLNTSDTEALSFPQLRILEMSEILVTEMPRTRSRLPLISTSSCRPQLASYARVSAR